MALPTYFVLSKLLVEQLEKSSSKSVTRLAPTDLPKISPQTGTTS